MNQFFLHHIKYSRGAALLFCLCLCVSCLPPKREVCYCCEVKTIEVALKAPHTKLLSLTKVSNRYDIIQDVAVKIIKSEQPIASGMEIYIYDFWHKATFANKVKCDYIRFGLKQIQYDDYGYIIAGFKESKKAYEDNSINGNNSVVSENYDASTVFLKFYNKLYSWEDAPYEIIYNEKDSLVKGKYYGDFMYLGSITWDVSSNIGAFKPIYNHVFEVKTRNEEPDKPRFIYIDRDYGLVKYILNNGDVWSVIHS